MGRFFLIVIVVALVWFTPTIVWHFQPSTPVHAILIDKTVPKPNYREHKSTFWVLNNLKYTNHPKKRHFIYDKDYYGFYPLPDEQYKIRRLPPQFEKKVDLVYLNDTYGVYELDFYDENLRGHRSKLMYGGITDEELDTLLGAMRDDTLLVAEFNVFATPTKESTRQRLEDILGLEWTGWIARYFPDLDRKNQEVPTWMIENYERQYDAKWEFTGPGFGYVNLNDQVIILTEGDDVGEKRNELVFTDKAVSDFRVKNRLKYNYWFDILKVDDPNNVLANYELDTTATGREKLNYFGLDNVYPAVVKNTYPYKTYYFAGDFADIEVEASLPRKWNYAFPRFLSSFLNSKNDETQSEFFWDVYYPMMQVILKKDLKATAAKG